MNENTWKTWGAMNMYDRYMLFIAIFGKTFLVLQIIKIVADSSSENVSFTAYVLYLITSVSWVVFGIYYRETIVTVSSFLGLVFGLVAANVVVIYKEDKGELL